MQTSVHGLDEAAEGAFAHVVGLEQVLCTDALEHRARRDADHSAENSTLNELMDVLVDRPDEILQALVDAALRLCGAGSAGISVLESGADGPHFVWRAIAGRWAPPRARTPWGPREPASPA